MIELYNVVSAGYTSQVTNDVEKVTGKKPVLFEEFVKTNLKEW